MSAHDHRIFDPNCPGCGPAVMDPSTGEVLPSTHPVMVIAMKIWRGMDRNAQAAFHRFTVLNGRDPEALRVIQEFGAAMEAENKKNLS